MMHKPDDTQPESSVCPRLGQLYNPLEGPQLDNPYPFYAQARSEAPVFFSEKLQAWVVSRYDVLSLVYASANRDESHFANADQFDPRRSPTRHLAFGLGTHFCVGAPLARIEGRIALEALSQRFPSLRLQPNQTFSYVSNVSLRALKHLEVVWDVKAYSLPGA